MKTLFYMILNFTLTGLYAQSDYFEGNRTYCSLPDNERAKTLFPLGIKCINLNVRLGSAFQCFTELIEMDSSFCDAYFWAAYTLRLSNKNEEALTYYYLADSFSQNKAIEFKQNLAYLSMQLGADSLARKKYEEMKEYFPNSPEGFYGIALTSTIIGDVEYGLKNINIAESKNIKRNKDILFIKAI